MAKKRGKYYSGTVTTAVSEKAGYGVKSSLAHKTVKSVKSSKR